MPITKGSAGDWSDKAERLNDNIIPVALGVICMKYTGSPSYILPQVEWSFFCFWDSMANLEAGFANQGHSSLLR